MELSIGEELVSWGRAALVETRGRVSGRSARAVVGFVEGADGSLLVAAGDANADWARNLQMDARCVVTIGERTTPYRAELLEGPARNAAVADLILRYGTPSERLGAGPVFRLIPDAGDQIAAVTSIGEGNE